jgi:hypothetical protein
MAYSGLALETHTSAEYRFVAGQLQRSRKLLAIRGLNKNHNHDLKYLFKSAHCGQRSSRTLPRLLRRVARQRDEALDGPSHSGAQDRGDYFGDLEERRTFRSVLPRPKKNS